MNNPSLAGKKECTGCMTCSDACQKTKALTIEIADDGHYYPVVNPEKCIGCKLCERTCPIVSQLDYQSSECSEFYAAWNVNTEQRKKSASGGAFSAMASKVLDEGGIVYGAAIIDVCNVRHIKVTEIADLHLLQGSKYTQSYTSGIYQDVLSSLLSGMTVLFSGTGCQVAGLYSFLGKKKYSGKLITADLICGGIPSKLLLDRFIENEPYEIKRVISYRTKDNGWKPTGFRYNLKVEDIDGIIHDYTDKRTLMTDGFSSELTNRYSCYQCKFAGTKRMSDFTIGDLWGDTKYPKQHYDGLSLIIAHNPEAIDWLNSAKEYLTIAEYDRVSAINSNFRIKTTNSHQYLMPERRYLAWIFNHCSYNTLKKIYAFDYGRTSPWMLYKAIRKIIEKMIK